MNKARIEYISTKALAPAASLSEALLRGQAPDGGLYLPTDIPKLEPDEIQSLAALDFPDLCAELTKKWLVPEFDDTFCKNLAKSVFNFPLPISKLTNNRHVLELFHGPTQSFKDFGARFLAHTLDHILTLKNEEAVIVTATSGDTGSAVAAAFEGCKRIKVFVLYPNGKISEIQRKQIALKRAGVFPICVNGTFDDCQALVKKVLADESFRDIQLSSANSINVGRLIPQSFYYAYLALKLQPEEGKVVCSVPSGNFGNLTAGFLAKSQGFPLHFIAATNCNDAVYQYFLSGKLEPKKSVHTYSSAMDVGVPSNFERIRALLQDNFELFKQELFVTTTDDETTLKIINEVWNEYRYLLDPHGAVAWDGLTEWLKVKNDVAGPLVSLATADPAKFPDIVTKACGEIPQIPEALAKQVACEVSEKSIENNYQEFVAYLKECL